VSLPRVHHPATLSELQEIVAAAPRIRVLGTRHTFNGIGDAPELVSLAGLPPEVLVDRVESTVTVPAAMTYGELAGRLGEAGRALHNLASLPHISVGGSVATATHGSGDGNGNLATAVAALELVTSSGEVVRAARGDDDFDGLVVGLGALGAVTRLTLDAEPAYHVSQRVYEGLAWDVLLEQLDAIFAAGYSVSVFTRWGDDAGQLWVKRRGGDSGDEPLFGAAPADGERHPIPGMDPIHSTAQGGRPGPWWDRLPHFRMGFIPSSGDELQSEFLVPRRHAVAAIEAVRALAERVRPVLHVSEIRTIGADTLWLSPQHRQATAGIHFTWKREPDAVARVLADVEAALAPFGARPHWGKQFQARADTIAGLYERLPDFTRLAERLDPRGAFRNDWLEQHLLGKRWP
jgi:xylitol oxidase